MMWKYKWRYFQYYTIQNGTFASFSYDDFTHPRRRHTANEPLSKDEELEPHFEFSGIPPMQLCRDRIADVTIQNDTYVFDISEVNGESDWKMWRNFLNL